MSASPIINYIIMNCHGWNNFLTPTSSYHPELMEEDAKHAYGTDILGGKDKEGEETGRKGAPVGHLVAYGLMGHHPAHIDGREETAEREQDIGREEIEEAEQRIAEQLQLRDWAQREGTEGAGNHGQQGDDAGTSLATKAEFLADEGSRRLVHGDDAGKGSKHQEHIEDDADDVS